MSVSPLGTIQIPVGGDGQLLLVPEIKHPKTQNLCGELFWRAGIWGWPGNGSYGALLVGFILSESPAQDWPLDGWQGSHLHRGLVLCSSGTDIGLLCRCVTLTWYIKPYHLQGVASLHIPLGVLIMVATSTSGLE